MSKPFCASSSAQGHLFVVAEALLTIVSAPCTLDLTHVFRKQQSDEGFNESMVRGGFPSSHVNIPDEKHHLNTGFVNLELGSETFSPTSTTKKNIK